MQQTLPTLSLCREEEKVRSRTMEQDVPWTVAAPLLVLTVPGGLVYATPHPQAVVQ